ncbi:MAG: amidohydrolase family protein [Tepidiformaceae bacterium]
MSRTVLRRGMLWDGRGEASRRADLAFEDGLVAPAADAVEAAQVLDISGCTVLPGLIEGHAHLCFNAQSDWRAVYDGDGPGRMLLRMAANGRAMLEAGITTVRDLGAPTVLAIEAREAFASGLALGPRLLVSGAPITTTGGHCHFMGGEADGELEIRKQVRERVKAGCDWIKVMATGGNMTPRTNTFEPQYALAELRACVDEARRLRRRVAAHAHGAAGIAVAVEAAVDSIEHCTFSVAGEGIVPDPRVIAAMAKQGTVVSPTVSIGYRTWTDDGRRAQRAQALRDMVAAGCPMIVSTDCGIPGVPHGAIAGAMEVLAECTGLRAPEVLRMATSGAARLLGLDDRGTLEAGRLADAVVVEGDPARDLAALSRVRYVFKAGELVRRAG